MSGARGEGTGRSGDPIGSREEGLQSPISFSISSPQMNSASTFWETSLDTRNINTSLASLLKEAEAITGNMNQQVNGCDGSQPIEVDQDFTQVSRKRGLKTTDAFKHKSKNCKSIKPRCLYYGQEHDGAEERSSKGLSHSYINCDEHLATPFDCSIIRKHKKVISLATHENIPQVEARRLVAAKNGHTNRSVKKDLRNFPYISMKPQQKKKFYWELFSNRFHNLRDYDSGDINYQHQRSYADIVTSPGRSSRKPKVTNIETLPTGRIRVTHGPNIEPQRLCLDKYSTMTQ
ncbi:hypothetical protein G5I_09529 [Acromyrmex echinatior]|uniref:Uncharacterized protein n=1 Tax=Acromyrmex echinatior TaxID=103372 RepID=F4WUG0_ACREC|nr:hypothetical protein G5I_09529 [Acromyrmex echinatior]